MLFPSHKVVDGPVWTVVELGNPVWYKVGALGLGDKTMSVKKEEKI